MTFDHKEKSLVGKLTDVKKGDRIRLWDEESEIMGYVRDISEETITLSTNHPSTRATGFAHAMALSHNYKEYHLRGYTNYAKQIDEEK